MTAVRAGQGPVAAVDGSVTEAAPPAPADGPTTDRPIADGPAADSATGQPATTEEGATPAAKAKKKRLDHVDAMRPIKQAGVVSTHSLLFFAPGASLAVGGALMLLHVTREAFLFISACMLTYSYYSLKRAGYGRFYRRRFVSVCVPYLAWTVIYFFVTLPNGTYTTWTGFEHFWYLVATGYYQLYYLLVIMQFYVFFPLMLAVVRRTRGHHLALLVVSLAVQVLVVSLMHWKVLPPQMRGFWASREIISYQFYLFAGMVVALHMDEVHRWICDHVRLVLAATVAAAAVAEVWYVLSARHLVPWMGSGSDPLQPIVIPFNIGAIACIYLVGVYLVNPRRSATARAMVRSGSDNSYGIYLAQMVFITALTWLGWRTLDHYIPWPVVSVLTVTVVFLGCILLTSLLARTPLTIALTGRQRQEWRTWIPERWRSRATTPAELAAEEAVSSPIDPDPETSATATEPDPVTS